MTPKNSPSEKHQLQAVEQALESFLEALASIQGVPVEELRQNPTALSVDSQNNPEELVLFLQAAAAITGDKKLALDLLAAIGHIYFNMAITGKLIADGWIGNETDQQF